MFCAYYDREADSRKLFENRKLCRNSSWDEHLGKYDVIRIVMTDFVREDKSVPEGLEKLKRRILDDLNDKYSNVSYDPDDFFYSLNKFAKVTETQQIIIIDEWDVVFRVRKEDKDGQTYYLNFLRDWLKDKPFIALAYITGILPIKKYGRHSALNMFDEYSMMAPMQLAAGDPDFKHHQCVIERA